ncbi:hypothetical protein BpHYR1_011022 [Brachionus plicatilis]|uniref:Uncharacterized protein n=1 Tax=Brachionus plicatilis TaxID=10195 RepID=A0A3M7P426_BRAPC|nr:hypothetical protein BpHYR1_011022 [Brachionus plicatilis]
MAHFHSIQARTLTYLIQIVLIKLLSSRFNDAKSVPYFEVFDGFRKFFLNVENLYLFRRAWLDFRNDFGLICMHFEYSLSNDSCDDF